MHVYKSGFTIVELLIVIVVIGILAAIVTVAFNGVRQRAEDTSMAAAVSQVATLIKTYKAQENKWPEGMPDSDREDFRCIGDNYPAKGIFTEGACHYIQLGSDSLAQGTPATTLLQDLRKVGTVSSFPYTEAGGGAFYAEDPSVAIQVRLRGMAVTFQEVEAGEVHAVILYGIGGSTCPAGDSSILNFDDVPEGFYASGNVCRRVIAHL